MVKPELTNRYIDSGKVRLVWHDFAWIGEESRVAAQGARCAGRQDRFWDYHDTLYLNQRGENRGQFAAANLIGFAAALGLDTESFGSCVAAGEDLTAIQEELSTARTQGITATPYFFLNGRRLVGAGSIDAFARAIDAELSRLGQ